MQSLIRLTVALSLTLTFSACSGGRAATDRPKEAISDAQIALTEYYRISVEGEYSLTNTKKRLDVFTKELEPIKTRLKTIPATDKSYSEAQKLLAEIEEESKELLSQADLQIRQAKAAEIERNFRREGVYDARVFASGPDSTVINFSSSGFTSSNVASLVSSEFLRRLKEWGYKKVVFTNGDSYTMSYNL